MESLVRYLREGRDEAFVDLVWKGMLFLSVGILFSSLLGLRIPYGRHKNSTLSRIVCNCYLNQRTSWLLMELPALVVPLFLLLNVGGEKVKGFTPNMVLLGMFLLHYIQRALIYPLCLSGGSSSSITVVMSAAFFCVSNGYLQGRSLIQFLHYDIEWLFSARFLIGHILFLTGMAINLHADAVLRSLRKPGETGYKIPYGGMFEYVSSANYFGESVEWIGFAIACWSMPALSFAVFTTLFLGSRALHHHRFYLDKFEDYPKHRKAFIPFIL